ncbi:hypothetical protein OHA_1_02915 [Pleomorphomonas sp. SM30]|uniref:Uncharacterized protein n=2 Tax=Oharaeibacter diazotrophicus TaxID=1920512 RepID=A0A4V3CVY2_9HYPH|nr:hypothetical protein EDD54_2874 [Oharaeibacter diazotrophicus]BBE73305.1 hypothetical protein OHA_1_02915 [Pleomorphomonas sp. SM30]
MLGRQIAHARTPIARRPEMPHMTAHSPIVPQDAPIVFNADRSAYERRVLSQAAYLSSACVADLLDRSARPQAPAPAEEMTPARPRR